MIKGWERFNESSGAFTEEMAQEIIYYFSEDSQPNKSIEKEFWDHPEMGREADNFVAYESGYDDYKQMIKKLMGMVNTKSLTFRDDMIEIYNKIRSEREGFPPICDIEDSFLSLIEEDLFDFVVYTKDYNYTINLNKEGCSLKEFIHYCQKIDIEMKRLETDKTSVVLEKCERYEGHEEHCWFKILLKKKF